ncbi:MAG: protein kinase [Acidobacteria bacterium]|nr:protein kinase [Acidobacteriota bacterium]
MNERIGHYELIEHVAEGGMGVIYRARDTRLDREVALKFLSPSLRASEQELERFLQEARAISRLNHPNIATIYAVEEDRGERFLAFEYLAGGSLADYIAGAPGQISVSRLLTWAIRIGLALAHAHRHGIVHRDVKPQNVLLTTDQVVKLTDFGLAEFSEKQQGRDGQTGGTAAYMSPEQAQELETDYRSDMYSFGVLLYELASGAVPFVDPRFEVVLYDVINTEPPSLREKRPDLPLGFVAIVDRLFHKDPSARYERMEDVVAAIEALSLPDAQSTARVEPTVAVLPLVDMSPEQDQEYFCDGLTEEAILALSSVKGLRVVSKTSSFRFKGGAYEIADIGPRLGVDSILEGSVKKAGDRLRVTVQLIRVSDGSHLWFQRYDCGVEDIFAIQDEISQSIAQALKLQLTARPTRKPVDAATYTLYLEGRYCLSQRTPVMLDRSLKRFEEAVKRDPEFAAAYAGMAEVRILFGAGQYPGDGARSMLDKARQAAEQALNLDPSLSEAHTAMALVHYRRDWAWSAAEAEFRKAIELNPNYATAHHQYAMFLAMHLRLEEARKEIAIAHELDPLSLIISTAVGRVLHFSRRYDEAIEQCQRTIELDGSFAPAYFDLAVSYMAIGDLDSSLAAIERMHELDQNPLRHNMMMAFVHAAKGETGEAFEWKDRFIALADEMHVPPTLFALLEAQLGNLDRAVEMVEQAIENHDSTLVYLQCESAWDPIRNHPRYPALLAKLGFRPPA